MSDPVQPIGPMAASSGSSGRPPKSLHYGEIARGPEATRWRRSSPTSESPTCSEVSLDLQRRQDDAGFEEGEETRYRLRLGDLVFCRRRRPGRTRSAKWQSGMPKSQSASTESRLSRRRVRRHPFVDVLPVLCTITAFFGQQCFTGDDQAATNLASFKRGRKSVPDPLPLNEQRRIVAKIDELFSDLDAGVAALERARANLKRYRAAVLKAAVEGKLTEQWRAEHPATEPASKLLERILAERRKKWEVDQLAKYAAAGKTPPKDWREKYVEPAGPDASGELHRCRAGGAGRRRIKLPTVQGGMQKPTAKKPNYWGSDIPLPPASPVLRASMSRLEYITKQGLEISSHAELEQASLGTVIARMIVRRERQPNGNRSIGHLCDIRCVHPESVSIRVRLRTRSRRSMSILLELAQYEAHASGTDIAASTSRLYTDSAWSKIVYRFLSLSWRNSGRSLPRSNGGFR